MIASTEKHSQDFEKYVALLRRLHELIAQGRGESIEAEQVRDEMDPCWSNLTDSEMERVEGLSADLYSLNDEELPPPDAAGRLISEQELRSAWDDCDWDRVLELLRYQPSFLTPDQVAFMRGHCWTQLGDLETSLLFYQRASKLCPKDDGYALMVALALLGVGRLCDSESKIQSIVGDASQSAPMTLLRAAGVLFSSSGIEPGSEGKERECRVIQLINTAISLNKSATEALRVPADELARYHVILGMCHEDLGDEVSARVAYDEASRLDPTNEFARVARQNLNSAASHGNQQDLRINNRLRLSRDFTDRTPDAIVSDRCSIVGV